ncbi:hypothetical protein V8B97DRAFT_2026172 [Scleroderma yunnanense]
MSVGSELDSDSGSDINVDENFLSVETNILSVDSDIPAYLHCCCDGALGHGDLLKWASKYEAVFDIYILYVLEACLQIAIICKNPHSHLALALLKTPPVIYLADLVWNCLSLYLAYVHPFLVNLDSKKYLNGTGLKGKNPGESHLQSVKGGQLYVCCAESYVLSNNATLDLIICMTPVMSSWLMQAEFEIESWDNQSVVSACAFIISQSAEAYHILFRHIFETAQLDTGLSVKLWHIHEPGIEAYCVELCHQMEGFCAVGHHCQLQDLDPYGQLKHFYHLCTVHFMRNLIPLQRVVTPKVYSAMLSFSFFEEQPNLERTLHTIQRGGHKARAQLKDKIKGLKFALPALYFPRSLILHDIWKAYGTNLNLSGGIMHACDYDNYMDASINIHNAYGIHIHDTVVTHVQRAF